MKPLRPSEGSLFIQSKIENLTPQQILQREKAQAEVEEVSLEELERRFVDGHSSLAESVAEVVEENRKKAENK